MNGLLYGLLQLSDASTLLKLYVIRCTEEVQLGIATNVVCLR